MNKRYEELVSKSLILIKNKSYNYASCEYYGWYKLNENVTTDEIKIFCNGGQTAPFGGREFQTGKINADWNWFKWIMYTD